MFDTQKPFDSRLFNDFHPTHSRLDRDLTKRFLKAFARESGFNTQLYGVDILVD